MTLSSSLLICASVSPNVPLIPSSVFLFTISLLSYVWFFFIFSNSFLNFSLCSSILLLNSLSMIMMSFYWVDYLSPLCLVLLWFYLVPSFGTYSSVASFWLILFYFYVLGMSVTFLILEKWPYVGDILWNPATQSSLVTRALCSRGVPYMDCVCVASSFVAGMITVGVLVGGLRSQR